MPDDLKCFRCGASLASLSLPLSRQDECPSCSVYVHVCKMCKFYDPAVPRQCREDDAEDVIDKEKLNFCDWFKPDYDRFDATRAKQAADAQGALAGLFGDGETGTPEQDEVPSEADKLFK